MVQFKDGEVSDVLDSFSTGENAVLGLAINPAGKPLVYFYDPGMLQRIDIKYSSGEQPKMQNPKTETSPEFEEFRKNKEITAFCFSADGHLFAAGCEDGSVQLFEGLYFNVKCKVDSFEKSVSNMDLNPSGFSMLVAVVKGGKKSSCVVADYESKENVLLELPKDISEAEFRSAKFQRDGTSNIITALNYKDAGYLVNWIQKDNEKLGWQLANKQKVSANNISAFDIGPEGNIIGLSDTEGNIAVVSCPKFTVLKRIKNAHMVYPTQLAFAAEGHAFASVAADASVTVIPTHHLTPGGKAGGLRTCCAFIVVLLILFVLAAIIAREQGYIDIKVEF
eukprot:TRINITY_DN25062_c1_g2_i1.p1 TRINITY_DN25062_c1_g2~~TRINITY_DN25062_c1_g2_i1.p1  ORF type:complete len:336 (-),score=45.14 TRINITY_DN25062_c1_g2_i1:413-1420(-)